MNAQDLLKPRIREISTLVEISKRLETLFEKTHASSVRVYEAEKIFNKFSLHLGSFERDLKSAEKNKTVDLAVLAFIARNIIETHRAIYYFCDRRLSKEELEFRLWLYDLHYSNEILSVLKNLGFTKSDYIFETFGLTVGFSERALENNSYFQSLGEKEKKLLLRGEKAFYWEGARSKGAPFSAEIENAIYKLLSNYIHSLPLGNTMYKALNSTNHLGFYNSAFLIVETTVCYSASLIDSYCSLRPLIAKRITKEERQSIKKLCTDKHLFTWLMQRTKTQVF